MKLLKQLAISHHLMNKIVEREIARLQHQHQVTPHVLVVRGRHQRHNVRMANAAAKHIVVQIDGLFDQSYAVVTRPAFAQRDQLLAVGAARERHLRFEAAAEFRVPCFDVFRLAHIDE